MTPIVSVIVPSYNAVHSIGFAIKSVLSQTISNWELIICDDASTDNTVDIIQAFNDPRIRLLINDKNLGPGPSRDKAIALAQGQWITVLDADDVYAPDRLEKLYQVASQHPNAIVFDEIIECHDGKEGLIPWRPVRSVSTFGCQDKLYCHVNIGKWLYQERTIIKWFAPKCIINKYGITHPNVRFAEDFGFALKALAVNNGELFYVPEILYFYRLGAGSLTTDSNRFLILKEMLKDSLLLFSNKPLIQEALNWKIQQVHRRMIYQQFFSALMQRQLGKATKEALAHPWVLPEFFLRSFQRIPYHVTRLRHRAAHRKTI